MENNTNSIVEAVEDLVESFNDMDLPVKVRDRIARGADKIIGQVVLLDTTPAEVSLDRARAVFGHDVVDRILPALSTQNREALDALARLLLALENTPPLVRRQVVRAGRSAILYSAQYDLERTLVEHLRDSIDDERTELHDYVGSTWEEVASWA